MSHLFVVHCESLGSQQLLSFLGPSEHVHEPLMQRCRSLQVCEDEVVVVVGSLPPQPPRANRQIKVKRFMGVSWG